MEGQTQQMRRFFTEKENSLFQNAGKRAVGERFNNFIENIGKKKETDGRKEGLGGA